jgi:WD40 repeat protein
MIVPALARSLPARAARRWRALRFRTRVVLALLTAVLPVVAWFLLRDWPDFWPARAVLPGPDLYSPLGFSPDGRTFLTYNKEGITPWDAKTGRKGAPWADQGTVVSGVFSPDGQTFAAPIFHTPKPRTIELIDTTTGRSRASIPSTFLYPAFEKDGRTLRAYQINNGVTDIATWDASTGQPISTRSINVPPLKNLATISRDGRLLVFVEEPADAIQLWDLEADHSVGNLPGPAGIATYGQIYARGLAFTADSRFLAAVRADGGIDLWDVPGRKLLKTLPAPSDRYRYGDIKLAPDGRTLAASVVQDMKEISSLDRICDNLFYQLFGREIRREQNYGVFVMDIATGRRIARVSLSDRPIFSPDSRALATRRFVLDLANRRAEVSIKIHDLSEPPK